MISIALTTYNGEKYLKEQLNSILNQSENDFELIICDDCSTDSTQVILNEYSKNDSRIKLFFNEKNLGFKKNFEKAISLCRGDYIALSDQDDIWTENHLKILKENIKDNYLICGNNLLVNEDGTSTDVNFFQSNCFSLESFPSNIDIIKKIMFSGSCFQGASMMFKSDFSKQFLPIPENLKYHDSWMVLLACFQEKLTVTEQIVTHYRQHSNQVTRNGNSYNFSLSRIDLLNNIFNRLSINSSELFYKEIIDFHKSQNSILSRLKKLAYFIKNHLYIYPLNNKKFLHLLKYLLKGIY